MTPEKLFMIQAHVIHELAAENESHFGRDVVLKDHENCYSFFIHSPLEERIKRIVETEHDRTTSEEDADQANRIGRGFLIIIIIQNKKWEASVIMIQGSI